jgi:hypothetical protein
LALIILAIWVVIGAIFAGLLWPPQVREWLWGSEKNEESQKKTIQEIKRILTFKDKESTLEVKLDSIQENFETKESTLEVKLDSIQENFEKRIATLSGEINQILDLLKNKD